MDKKVQVLWLIGAGIFLAKGAPVWAQAPEAVSTMTNLASTAGFLLLLPLGLILLTSSALPEAERDAPRAAAAALVIWAAAALAYFGAGFAFQFGGLAVGNPQPDFVSLYWNWSPFDESFGSGWGVIGLRGWALLNGAATSGVYDLFLRHVALLGVVTVIPSFILYRRLSALAMLLFGILAGTLIYPVAGNWIWSSGWLASLGLTLGSGHGFVDAGAATPFAIAGVICLAALLAFQESKAQPAAISQEVAPDFVETSMPTAYLPLLSFTGLLLTWWSWAFIAGAAHIPTATAIDMSRAALNGILAAMSAGLAAALYSRFTTTQFDPLMTARGGVAGLVLASAVAPFIPPWEAIIIGLVGGGLTPLLIYLVDQIWRLADHTASVATFALLGLLAWLLPGFLADGSSGAGWNKVGETSYLGVEGQGVSGLMVAPGHVNDWPGQFNAQLIGAVAIVAWTFLLSFALFNGYAWWKLRRQPKGADIEADPAGETEEVGEAVSE